MARRNHNNLAESIRLRFAPFGGMELELPKRDAMRECAGATKEDASNHTTDPAPTGALRTFGSVEKGGN
jgi:hypothetical protein